MFIKTYLSFIIKIKEEKYRMCSDISSVPTDDHSDPDSPDNVNRQDYKHLSIILCILTDDHSV